MHQRLQIKYNSSHPVWLCPVALRQPHGFGINTANCGIAYSEHSKSHTASSTSYCPPTAFAVRLSHVLWGLPCVFQTCQGRESKSTQLHIHPRSPSTLPAELRENLSWSHIQDSSNCESLQMALKYCSKLSFVLMSAAPRYSIWNKNSKERNL